MIIKMTFNDNDFTELLEKFASKLTIELSCYGNRKENNAIMGILTSETKDASVTDKEIIINAAKELFKNLYNRKKDFDYLQEHLKISVVDSITEEWCNGEVVYVSTKSNKFMTF